MTNQNIMLKIWKIWFQFYFFRNYKDRYSTDVLLNDIINYYKGKINGSNFGKIEIKGEGNKVQLKKKGSNIFNQKLK